MPKVDFYILPDTETSARELFACRLTEKAYSLGHRVYLHTRDAAHAARLDQLLWTFRDGSFLPHELSGPTAAQSPIVVGYQTAPIAQDDLLITLADTFPDHLLHFARIAEIVAGDDEQRSRARERYRRYRDLGYELESHQRDGVQSRS